MVFSSLPFLFIFISLTCLFYFAFRSLKWRNGVLLFASLVFYSWGEPRLVLLMALVVHILYRTAKKKRIYTE